MGLKCRVNKIFCRSKKNTRRGQSLVELLLAIGIAALVIPTLGISIMSSRSGKAQLKERFTGTILMKEAQDAVRSVREKGWTIFALNGTFHPVISGSSWTLTPGAETVGNFNRQVVISDVNRDSSGAIVSAPNGSVDPSTKQVTITVSWIKPLAASVTSTTYLTRYLDNLSFVQTTLADFTSDTRVNTDVTNTSGGEVQLGLNTKAKWCSPEFSSTTIDLPDGPPVSVAARANSSASIPNDVFVVTSPTATESVKLAYVQVTANNDPPVTTLKGTFTLDPAKYSNAGLVPSGIGIDNNFKTNMVKYYTSAAGNLYALIATTKLDKEVIAIKISDINGNQAYQDSTNKIYKYWTSFNTRLYNPNAGLNTGYLSPTSNAADSGGDGNGFDSNPTRAYSQNNSFAVDNNSGNGNGTNCTGADKDKHRFYNYGFSLPSGATINGISVRLDAKVDNQTGSPFMCVQMSWDGGTTWTSAKSTSTLNTTVATYYLGSSSDTWGRTWNDTNFANSNFRVRVIDVASNTSRAFSLDWVAINVYYSGGGAALNDQAPFDYGGTGLTVLNNTGYVSSGGYLYAFDLSNIDSKSSVSELDQVGCRIQLDGYDCKPGTGTDKKYNSGETGTSWSDTTSPAHNDCSDGGNIELYATNDLYGVTTGGHNYLFVAVGAGTNPEFEIVDATSVPDGGTSPAINSASCGRVSGGNSGWKMIGSLDFNSQSNTEEAANSVYAKSDGTRAYVSSNGGIDGNGNGQPDSKQFYVIDTSTKTAPKFLSGTSSTGATSGYYYGSTVTISGTPYHNDQMFPRRSLTVLNGQRVVLVGKNGFNNGNDTLEYQVLDSTNETTPNYCGGINFNSGFNDLTSVSEADGDNFVYMVANTNEKQLKVIQGGPDGTYSANGTIESTILDIGYSTAFNSYTANYTQPGNTTLQFQFAGADPVNGSCTGATFNYAGPDGTAGTYFATSSATFFVGNGANGYKNPARCFRYKAYFSTIDYNTTSILRDMTINYSP